MAKRVLKRATDLSKEFRQDADYAALYCEVANEEIGAALRAVRKARGLSQREVASRMSVTRARISQIESVEGTSLALEVLSRYAKAVRCQLDISLRDASGKAEPVNIFVPDVSVASSAQPTPKGYQVTKDSDDVFPNVIPYHNWARAA